MGDTLRGDIKKVEVRLSVTSQGKSLVTRSPHVWLDMMPRQQLRHRRESDAKWSLGPEDICLSGITAAVILQRSHLIGLWRGEKCLGACIRYVNNFHCSREEALS